MSLSCTADGLPIPSIQWLKDGCLLQTELNDRFFITEEVVSDHVYNLAETTRSTLTLFELNSVDSGVYTCQVYNGIGLVAVLEEPYSFMIPRGKLYYELGIIITTTSDMFICLLLYISTHSCGRLLCQLSLPE